MHACVMLALAAVSFPAIVLSHMTHRVAFTHATRASHPADIRDPKVSGGPNLVRRAPLVSEAGQSSDSSSFVSP